MSAYDVIVIGGGHNGLVTAATLAAKGRSVVILEQGEQVGGLAIGDEFHPGYTSAGPLHDTSGFTPTLLSALDLGAMKEPTAVFAPQVPGDGPGLLLHHDAAQAAEEIARHSRKDPQAVRRLPRVHRSGPAVPHASVRKPSARTHLALVGHGTRASPAPPRAHRHARGPACRADVRRRLAQRALRNGVAQFDARAPGTGRNTIGTVVARHRRKSPAIRSHGASSGSRAAP